MEKKEKRSQVIVTKEYARILADLKKQIKDAQTKAVFAVNRELIKLYWNIGEIIVAKQKDAGWGSNFIEQLARDLQKAFPGLGGFSRANIFHMRAFYLAYQKSSSLLDKFIDLPIFNIPWWHNVILLMKLKDQKERLWYAQQAIEHGWSRSMLETWIESDLFGRKGKAVTNFKSTLPAPLSDMAQQSLKDPYLLDFLELREDYIERDIEQGLIDNIEKALLELGKGFAFVGRQYHLEVSDNDFYIDLLFYNYHLHCFVVLEVKARKFDPRDAGQLNFYLSVVDNQIKRPEDGPTIGILLCKSKDNLIVEYALQSIAKPIGVSDFKVDILKKLPKEFKSSLPTIEELEFELEKIEATKKIRMAKARPRKTVKKVEKSKQAKSREKKK